MSFYTLMIGFVLEKKVFTSNKSHVQSIYIYKCSMVITLLSKLVINNCNPPRESAFSCVLQDKVDDCIKHW